MQHLSIASPICICIVAPLILKKLAADVLTSRHRYLPFQLHLSLYFLSHHNASYIVSTILLSLRKPLLGACHPPSDTRPFLDGPNHNLLTPQPQTEITYYLEPWWCILPLSPCYYPSVLYQQLLLQNQLPPAQMVGSAMLLVLLMKVGLNSASSRRKSTYTPANLVIINLRNVEMTSTLLLAWKLAKLISSFKRIEATSEFKMPNNVNDFD